MSDVRCLVKKYKGDFERACELGYSINLHCAEGYMWLVMPVTVVKMESLLAEDGFTKVSEVEYR